MMSLTGQRIQLDDRGERSQRVVEAAGCGTEADGDAGLEAQREPPAGRYLLEPLERFRVALDAAVGEDERLAGCHAVRKSADRPLPR